jgi:predicted nuclease with RNAse H fold
MSQTIGIVGIDCATVASKRGVCLATWSDGILAVDPADMWIASSRNTGNEQEWVSVACDWLRGRSKAVIALDAPLGWPRALGRGLCGHVAGEVLGGSADDLFSRHTDREIHRRTERRPLEVGANLIARTAHSALLCLDAFRRELGQPIPVAWEAGEPNGVVAIEVYPRVTRKAHGADEAWPAWVRCETPPHLCLPLDRRDAVLCAVAAVDFIEGRALAPTDLELAKQEGWIWAADTAAGQGNR